MKGYAHTHRRWLRAARRRSLNRRQSGASSQPELPLRCLLWLPACFCLGLLLGLLCSPGGWLRVFAESKAAYRQAQSAQRTNPTDPGGLLVLPGTDPAPTEQPPRVCVYCTHAGEEYAGQTRVNGQAGGVMTAAAALVRALEERGVGVVFDQTLHDSPSYDGAYSSSLTSITAIQEAHPEIEVYIDLHRDSAIEGVSTTLETDRGSFARMMFIIGTDEKLEHPNWRQNQAFVLGLRDALEALEPGITREPRVYSGRYNQHIAPEAFLVEVGSNSNTVEQAQRSAALLAEALCQVKGW